MFSFLAKSSCLADALGDALDTSSLTWTTGGSENWQAQTTSTHDGIDAASSGDIGSSSESWIQTNVTGPGTLTWWWKVSSEEGFDYLEFYLDDTLQSGRISGEVGWVQVSREILPGSHTVRWRYQKDGSATDGTDSGFLDEVVFTPVGPVNTGSAGPHVKALHPDKIRRLNSCIMNFQQVFQQNGWSQQPHRRTNWGHVQIVPRTGTFSALDRFGWSGEFIETESDYMAAKREMERWKILVISRLLSGSMSQSRFCGFRDVVQRACCVCHSA